MRALLARLGDPHRGLSVVHVAGSKGKGSTALFAEALLRALGERVGTYTSPHLESWSERFRLDGAPVAGERLAAVVERMRPHVEALRAGDPAERPTWFDATTAAAFALFAEAGVDRAVVEVGLGGRLDSTNAATAAVACVTGVELEHTRQLGDTLAAVAGEKAGILEAGRPAVVGALAPEARAVVAARAAELGAPASWLGDALGARVLAEDDTGQAVELRDGDFTVRVRLAAPGRHQAENAALALACVRRLGVHGDDALRGAAERALPAARLPARIEVLSREPCVVVDAAHTAASVRALTAVLARLRRGETRLVLSVSSDKNLEAILAELAPLADVLTLTRAEPVRSLDPETIARAVRSLRPELAPRVVPNPHLAVRAAREGLPKDGLLCATGSVYLAGIARRVLAPTEPDAGG